MNIPSSRSPLKVVWIHASSIEAAMVKMLSISSFRGNTSAEKNPTCCMGGNWFRDGENTIPAIVGRPSPLPTIMKRNSFNPTLKASQGRLSFTKPHDGETVPEPFLFEQRETA